jgi:hypothetical protein
MSRSFEIPSAGRLSLARAVNGPAPALDSGGRRQILSLFDVSDRNALPAVEEMPCPAR